MVWEVWEVWVDEGKDEGKTLRSSWPHCRTVFRRTVTTILQAVLGLFIVEETHATSTSILQCRGMVRRVDQWSARVSTVNMTHGTTGR